MAGRLLGAKYSLYDVDDAEGFCAQLAGRAGLELSYHEREDLLAFLISTCWQLSTKYEPGGMAFSTYATYTLKLRIVDWQRAKKGRSKWQFKDSTYERPRAHLVSLDALDSDGDLLGDTLTGSSLDDDERRLSDELRALRARGRRPGRRDD
jgi:hypothetical protein